LKAEGPVQHGDQGVKKLSKGRNNVRVKVEGASETETPPRKRIKVEND
jgi:hypothetical protein